MFFQEQADNKQIKIYVKNKNIQNAIKGDPDLLTQVFMNIVDNSIKYGHEGCTVTVDHWIQEKTNELIITLAGEGSPFSWEETIVEVGGRGKAAEGKTSS